MSDQTMHIAIDVSLTGDQIQGQVGDGVGAPTPFSGWLGLIGQLDELLGTGSTTAGTGLSNIEPKEQ